MKLHTVFITYNRLELTQRAIDSYLRTVTVPHAMWVVDNASTDGTREWIRENIREIGMGFTLFKENRYPGVACNEGWSIATGADGIQAIWDDDGPTHLHRADNDFIFLGGWCEEIERIFQNPKIGQVGLRTDEEEGFEPGNTGGNCVIRRELWDAGLRYDERPWPQIREENGAGYSEDSFFSSSVRGLGYRWTRVKRPCIKNLATGDWTDPYYQESYGVRGIRPHEGDPTVPEGFVPPEF